MKHLSTKSTQVDHVEDATADAGHATGPAGDAASVGGDRRAAEHANDAAATDPDHQARLGARLRSIRHQQGLSLAAVQEKSGGRWKAVVVGAYERGDRTITIARLQELARFYGVPLADLLPTPAAERRSAGDRRYVIDLGALRQATASGQRELLPVARFAAHIRRHRGDHNGRVLTIRASDMDMLALTTGQDPVELVELLRRDGALRQTA